MKKYKETYIIGIDHGYGNMKTANCCFQAGVTIYDKEPIFKDNLLVWNNKYYLIGAEHKEFSADFVNTVMPPMLIKFQREISDAVCLEGGKSVLPPSKFTGNRKKDYWIHKNGGLTQRDILKRDIDEAISNTTNWKAFDLYLKNLDCSYARSSNYRHPFVIALCWKCSVRTA